MTIENDLLREHILAHMASPQLGVPEYEADPIVVRRVGRVLAETSGAHQIMIAKGGLMSNVFAKAALAGLLLTALVLPAAAAPTLDDRHGGYDRHGVADERPAGSAAPDDRVRERPNKRPAAISQKTAPKYNGYYGPVAGPSNRPKAVLLGVGGWW